MAVTQVQKTQAQSSGAVSSITATLNTVAASNLLAVVVSVSTSGTPPATLTVSDSQGSYTSLVREAGSGANTSAAEEFYLKNTTSGTHTITVTPSSSSFMAVEFQELTGADTASPADPTTSTGTGTDVGSNTLTTSANVGGAATGEYILAGITSDGSATNYSAGTGYTLDQNYSSSASTQDLGAEHKTPVNAAEKPVISQSTITTAPWYMVAAAFEPAAAVATIPNKLLVVKQSVPNAVSF